MITVALIEDHPDIRENLHLFLDAQENMLCKITVESMEAYFDALKTEHAPQVILLDIGLPGMSGIEGARRVKQQYPLTNIIVLTVHDNPHDIFDALCAGASGYLLKDTPLSEIKTSIEMLFQGGSPMSPQIARKVVEYFNARPSPPQPPSPAVPDSDILSRREQQIVNAIIDGLSYKLIADSLTISIDTVRTHIRRIYRKLHVNSKAEVITRTLGRK